MNTAHLLGICLLIGSVVSLDLRLLGVWRNVDLSPLSRVLQPVAIAGFGLAASMGCLLFIARAADYLANPVFWIKLIFVSAALVNALWLWRTDAWRQTTVSGQVSPLVRVGALVSLMCWLAALLCGRLVGYR